MKQVKPTPVCVQRRRAKHKQRAKRNLEPRRHLTRNQKEVLTRLQAGDYDTISVLGWGLFQSFFFLLRRIGVFDVLSIHPEAVKRVLIPLDRLFSCYVLKVLLGIASMNRITTTLFRERALLLLVGFSAKEIVSGFTSRGKKRKDGSQKEGPFHKDTLADLVAKLTEAESEWMFNEVAQRLDKHGFLPQKSTYILDATDLPTPSTYEKRGRKTVEVKKYFRGSYFVQEITLYGYKLLALREKLSGIIVAAKVVQIQRHESPFTLELIQKAEANLGQGRIAVLVMDRGFLDGLTLWKLKHDYHIDFIVPLKEGMDALEDMRGFRNEATDGEYFFHQSSHDGKTEVIGLRDLNTYVEYGDDEHQQKNKTSKRFVANPINGVLVVKWDGKDVSPGEEVGFVTSLTIDKPISIIDEYAYRSDIENQGFRELKQGWMIEKFPTKQYKGVIAHIFLTLLTYNAAAAFRTERGKQLLNTGIRSLREHLCVYKVLVTADKYYAIFDLEDLMAALGFPPKETLKFPQAAGF
jgi:hypothetical protein